MPTPILIDGFEHQVKDNASFAGTYNGLWQTITDSAHLTFPAGRNGTCLQIAPAGAACGAVKQFNDPPILVTSFYIKTSTSGVNVDLGVVFTSAFSAAPTIALLSDGKLRMTMGATNVDTTLSYNDGAWHRIDIRSDVTTNPWVMDWQVDGSAQTQITNGVAGTVIRQLRLGTGAAHTYTCQYDDLVCSTTTGDYPLGIHDVLYGVPTGDNDKTHGGVNVLEATATGTDIDSTTAYTLLDEIPATTTDYIVSITTGAGNYAEVTFDDQPVDKTIWGVEGVAALFASATTATATAITRIVDSGGSTLTDIYTGDMSETSLNYRRAIITAPGGGWDGAGYQGVKARVGFCSAVNSQPRWAALMLQYAVIDAPGAAPTAVDPMGMTGFFGA